MAQVATIPPPTILNRPRSPRNFLKANMEEVKELSELNREKHEAEAEKRKREEEEALLKEMGLLDKTSGKSRINSRSNSRSTSPSKINLRSRSNSPSAVLQFENTQKTKELANTTESKSKPLVHRSRISAVSKSQPQSSDTSPKTSKIPKRQNSVSPARNSRNFINYRRPFDNSLNKNQRFISNSTSSIHETIRIGSQVHDKRAISQSAQFLDISPNNIHSKPPISPGKVGPPPSNRSISSKRLSPIVGTPNKSPVEDLKSSSAKTTPRPSPAARKSTKTAGGTPATSRLNSRQNSRSGSRDPSPEKKTNSKVVTTSRVNSQNKTATRTPSTRTTQKTLIATKNETKKPINRTNSTKSLTRTESSKNISDKPPLSKSKDKKNELNEKAKSTSKINEVGDIISPTEKSSKSGAKTKEDLAVSDEVNTTAEVNKEDDEKLKQDNETQYDKITNEKGDLIILTKKNIVSMTTAAITAQPLEVVTTVTNQLPAALEKAREKGIFERLGSKDSLAPKENEKEESIAKESSGSKQNLPEKDSMVTKDLTKEEKNGKYDDKKPPKPIKTLYGDDNIKLKLLQPPYNNPQVERVKQKIDSILKEPEISTEYILASTKKIEDKVSDTKDTFKSVAHKTKSDIHEAKKEVETKLDQVNDEVEKETEKITTEIRTEATKIVDSIITPVEEPKEIADKQELKENLEPIVMVVNEKGKNILKKSEVIKVNETLVKGEPEVEVQSSNVSTPGLEKITINTKAADGSVSDKSTSNGGFPQSTSTTPKPPPRAQRQAKLEMQAAQSEETKESPPGEKKPNICARIMGKCKSKCCSCCAKPKEDETTAKEETKEEPKEERKEPDKEAKKGLLTKLNCFKKKEMEKDKATAERAAGKVATIEFESETKRRRKLRDVLCGCCRRRRVKDSSGLPRRIADVGVASPAVQEVGCCGKRRKDTQRRDSILSDRTSNSCCNNRLCQWIRGACRRNSEQASTPRASLFSKNKSLSPTLPPEDTRTKLDPSLVEHTSVMRGAIPVLPLSLAYFCLFCNILVPGLGTIFSGLFCLCFGIPRFGIHDSPKHRIGSFVINLLVGCGQLFTVLFCLVGWGWSIWWGTIMVRTSRKYRKLKAEAAIEEAEAAPPVTSNNHTRT
ncbi:unnamed protein product, partial [Iphiclides podalirius]